MYISVDDLKRHLNIDYDEDDQYLTAIELYIQQPLSNLADDDGNLPSDLKMAVRILAGGFYANREPAAFAASSEIPYGLTFLLIQRRKLS